MEDDNIQAVEQEESDSFMEGWDDEGGSAEADGAPEVVQEPAGAGPDEPQEGGGEEPEGEGREQEEPAQEAPSAAPQEQPRTWTLTHQGQALTVNERDMALLAQRGLDSVQALREYEESRPVVEMLRSFAQQAGMSLSEYAAVMRTQAKQAGGMSLEDAKRAVELEDREAAIARQEAGERQRAEAQRQELARRQAAQVRMESDLAEFRQTFPEAAADPASIPKEVWAAVQGGASLVGAYARYANAQAQAEQAAAEEAAKQQEAVRKQNAANAARAVGSLKSAGGEGPKDPFLEGWDED